MDAAQEARQDGARAAMVLAEAAGRVAPRAGDDAPLLKAIAAQASAQADALGGVWVAWPDGAPEGVATPEPSPTADPSVRDLTEVRALLHAGMDAHREAAMSAPQGPIAAREASLAASRAAQIAALDATRPDAHPPPPPIEPGVATPEGEAVAPAPAPDPQPTAYPGAEPRAALETLDAARYGLETAAARLDGPTREVAAAAAADTRSAGQALVDGGSSDTRRAAYPTGRPSQDPLADARRALAPVLDLHIAAIARASNEERPALLAAAQRTAMSLGHLGAVTSGELAALPGLAPEDAES